MRLNAPTKLVWIIAVVLGVLGLLGELLPSAPIIGQFGFWFVVIGWLLLAIATLAKGM